MNEAELIAHETELRDRHAQAMQAAREKLDRIRDPADRAHAQAIANADKTWHDTVDPAEAEFAEAVDRANTAYNQAMEHLTQSVVPTD